MSIGNAERTIGNVPDSFYVTIADDISNRTRLRTSSTVYSHSRDNLNGLIFLVSRKGAFNITYHRLALIDYGISTTHKLSVSAV